MEFGNHVLHWFGTVALDSLDVRLARYHAIVVQSARTPKDYLLKDDHVVGQNPIAGGSSKKEDKKKAKEAEKKACKWWNERRPANTSDACWWGVMLSVFHAATGLIWTFPLMDEGQRGRKKKKRRGTWNSGRWHDDAERSTMLVFPIPWWYINHSGLDKVDEWRSLSHTLLEWHERVILEVSD